MTELALQSPIPRLKEIWHKVKIDGDETYRYTLELIWDRSKPAMGFLGLNPSTASTKEPDRTCMKFFLYATREGAGGFIVGNLAAHRSREPKALRTVKDPIGPRNAQAIKYIVERARPLIVCWGADRFAKELDRGNKLVREIYVLYGKEVSCLGRTGEGFPNHPLYLPGDQKIEPYAGRG